MSKGKFLIIDEISEEQEHIMDLLSDGFELDKAENYTEAVEKLKTSAFDLIIMELKLSGLDSEKSTEVGIDLLFYIKQSDIRSAVLILTDCPSLDTYKQTRELGIYGYLSKDETSGEKLITAITKAYEKFQSAQKNMITDFDLA
ncbi:response regulator, partial [bacterium]|nr:response regulator [bacterium]